MKVPASIRRLYEDQEAANRRLRKMVDSRIRSLKNDRWHYESRVKELISFALKVETGRVADPSALEDFFACTIVVANADGLQQAEELICSTLKIQERRPKRSDQTHKTPERFSFDDLRLYVTLRDDPSVPPTDLQGVVFEVQIKTFLQHAWSIATHDLIYKTDDADWGKERIAFQVKAMLEHAEVSIQEAGKLAASSALRKDDPRTRAIRAGVSLMTSQWDDGELPVDVRRLATNVLDLLEALDLNVSRLRSILEDGKDQRGGFHPANLSPYGTIVQYLIDAEWGKMRQFLTASNSPAKALVTVEIEFPSGFHPAEIQNAVCV